MHAHVLLLNPKAVGKEENPEPIEELRRVVLKAAAKAAKDPRASRSVQPVARQGMERTAAGRRIPNCRGRRRSKE